MNFHSTRAFIKLMSSWKDSPTCVPGWWGSSPQFNRVTQGLEESTHQILASPGRYHRKVSGQRESRVGEVLALFAPPAHRGRKHSP